MLVLLFCSQTSKITARWINLSISEGQTSPWGKLCVLHGYFYRFFFRFNGLRVADINLLMVSAWICRLLHVHGDSVSGCCSALTKESVFVSAERCQNALGNRSRSSSVPVHFSMSLSDLLHLHQGTFFICLLQQWSSCPACVPGSDMSSPAAQPDVLRQLVVVKLDQ